MKLNKSKLVSALLALLGMAYLGVMIYLGLQADDSDTAYAILFCGIFGSIIAGILYGIFLDLYE